MKLESLNKKESINPVCYAVKASEEIRKNSSSGGAFYLLAEKILNKSGLVIG